MALVHLHKTHIRGKEVTGGIVMQTNCMSEIQASGTGSTFKFYEDPQRKRGFGYDYVVTETPAVIRAAMNTVPSDIEIALDVFPHNDPTQDTVRYYVLIDNIVKTYPAEPPVNTTDRDRSWVMLNFFGLKVERLLVDQYYLDLVSIEVTGSTSTTTSSTSTTSTSSTSTTSTSSTSSTSTSSTTTGP